MQQTGLFDENNDRKPDLTAQEKNHANHVGALPLAERMRPLRFEQYVGQDNLVSMSSGLRRAIEQNQFGSFLLWGPPGCGKTTLAKIVAQYTDRQFLTLSAVMAGVKDIKESVEKARMAKQLRNQQTILFVDEIHRFNKSQQDALLPFVEDGTVTLIGATTENPSFELNAALLSRMALFILKPLDEKDLLVILERALSDPVKGLSASDVQLDSAQMSVIAGWAQGDARRALGYLERLVVAMRSAKILRFHEDAEFKEFLNQALGASALRYDATGEEHYNCSSALIKSLRDSDPHAAIYYLARMLEGGEDPLFIARRLVIFASEDVGNADPRALQLAIAGKEAVAFVGMPEARINLAQVVTYLASVPKSNASYVAIDAAIDLVRKTGPLVIPQHILNAPTTMMKKLGYGKGYQYAHNIEEGVTSGMNNLPEAMKDTEFYQPKPVGLEKNIYEYLRRIGRLSNS